MLEKSTSEKLSWGIPSSPDFPLQMRALAPTTWCAPIVPEKLYNEWSLCDLGHGYPSDVGDEDLYIQDANIMNWLDTSSGEAFQRSEAPDGNYVAGERGHKYIELDQPPHYTNKESDSLLQGTNSGNPHSANPAFTASNRPTDALSAAFAERRQQQAQWQVEEQRSNQTTVKVENNLNGKQQEHKRLTESSANLQILENSERRMGIRTGPLSKAGRENARKMRRLRSCFRCFVMREKCVPEMHNDGVCLRCRELANEHKLWTLPCTGMGLEERTNFMLPSNIVHQLKESEIQAFIKDHIAGMVRNSYIKLRLIGRFGEPLPLDAAEFTPRGYKNMRPAQCDRPKNLLSTCDPPIITLLVDRRSIAVRVNSSIDSLIRGPCTNLSVRCFPDFQDLWLREILTCICRYHQMNLSKLEADRQGPYETLRWALKLTLLTYTMCHHFVVPEQEVESLRNQLQHFQINYPPGMLCPSLVNRIIKSILLPMLTHAVQRVLSDLQRLLRSRNDESALWNQTFCIVFLCLTVVGNFQASLVERAETALADHTDSFTLNDAMSGILEMEGELSIHLIGMFHSRFGTKKKGNRRAFNPLAKDPIERPQDLSELADSIRSVMQTYDHTIPKATEVEEVELTRLKSENVARLLSKFMQPFYQGVEFPSNDFLIDPATIAGLRTMCSSAVLDEHGPKTWLNVRVWSEEDPQCLHERLALIDTGAETDCISDEFCDELKIQNREQAERGLMWGDDQPVVDLGRVKLYVAWAGPGGKTNPEIVKWKFYVVQDLGVPISLSGQANEKLKLMEYATALPKSGVGKHLHGPLFTRMTKAEKEQERVREEAVRNAAKIEEEQERKARAAKRRILQNLPSQGNSNECMPSDV